MLKKLIMNSFSPQIFQISNWKYKKIPYKKLYFNTREQVERIFIYLNKTLFYALIHEKNEFNYYKFFNSIKEINAIGIFSTAARATTTKNRISKVHDAD